MADDQIRRGWQVTIVAPPGGELEAGASRTGARYVPWKAARGLRNVARETRDLAQIIGGLTTDVVHLHSSKAGMAGRLALRGRRPTIFQPHGWSFLALTGLPRRAALEWERRAASLADVVVCVSEGELATGRAAGIDARWRVVPNGVDVDHFEADPRPSEAARRRLGLDPGRPVVVCAGRLCHQKGQDVLVAAWPRVRAAVPDARLVLVGDGPLQPALEQRLPPGVVLTGWREDVDDWLAAADLVVAPSRYEGLNLVVLEAMAGARAVVASDVEGMDVITAPPGPPGGETVPVGCPEPLAAAIVLRLEDEGRRTAEGRAGRARVERSHSLDVWLPAIADLTRSVVDGSRGAERTPPAAGGR